jgi:hypothetical protein
MLLQRNEMLSEDAPFLGSGITPERCGILINTIDIMA